MELHIINQPGLDLSVGYESCSPKLVKLRGACEEIMNKRSKAVGEGCTE